MYKEFKMKNENENECNSSLRRTVHGSPRTEWCAKTHLHCNRSYCRRARAADWRSALTCHSAMQSRNLEESWGSGPQTFSAKERKRLFVVPYLYHKERCP